MRLRCAAFPQTLAGCTEAAAFVLTLGARIDERVIAQCDAGDLLDALLLETAAWLALEDATRQFRAHLRAVASARREKALDAHLAAIVEISLAGEIRVVSGASQRAAEAVRLGYTTVVDASALHLREAVRLAFASAHDDALDVPEF